MSTSITRFPPSTPSSVPAYAAAKSDTSLASQRPPGSTLNLGSAAASSPSEVSANALSTSRTAARARTRACSPPPPYPRPTSLDGTPCASSERVRRPRRARRRRAGSWSGGEAVIHEKMIVASLAVRHRRLLAGLDRARRREFDRPVVVERAPRDVIPGARGGPLGGGGVVLVPRVVE